MRFLSRFRHRSCSTDISLSRAIWDMFGVPRTVLCLLFVIIFVAGVAGADAPGANHGEYTDNPLLVTAVQIKIDEKMYASEAAFVDRISGIVENVMTASGPDLIVFPEYLNVFFSLIPYAEQTVRSENFEQGLVAIREQYPEIDSLRSLFLSESDYTRDRLDAIWGGIADRWDVTIVAGSYFARENYTPADAASAGNTVTSRNTELRNRTIVYGPDGDRIYTQDKVYLTEFETEEVKLDAATVQEAGYFLVKGRKIGVTLCRDTFFDVWNEKQEDLFLWIDLKANGAVFTMQEQVRFIQALPERISETKIPFGLTVCLTGGYLDLFWEGESSFIRPTENGYEELMTSESPKGQEILTFALVPRR